MDQISASAVQPGDHLYPGPNVELLSGIAVRLDVGRSEIFVVMSDGLHTFRLITLQEFQGRGILYRAVYDQDQSHWRRFKLFGTRFHEKKRPAEEIVQNALLLLGTANKNPEWIKEVFPHGTSDFARLCCTTSHEQWRNQLQQNGNNLFLVNNFEQSQSVQNTFIGETPEEKLCCSKCMDRPCDLAFACGHLACSECAELLDTCHICQRAISEKIPLLSS